MKKRLIIVMMVICTGLVQGNAQVKPFRFGIKLSPNVSWLRPQTEGYESDGALMGFGWGFISDITLTDNYFFSTGFDMDWNYAKLYYPHMMEGIDGEGTLYRTYKMKAIDIPLSIKMRTNQFDKFAFFGQLGIVVGFNLSAKSEDQFEYMNNQEKVLTPVDENEIGDEITLVRSFVLFGGGVEFFLDESTSLMASITYKNGLTNVLDGTNDVNTSLSEKAFLNYLQLNLGIIF